MRSRPWLTLTVLVVTTSPAAAQTEARVVKLLVHPAGPSVPAMRYELLPSLSQLQPGNAALGYMRAYSPEWTVALRRHPDYPRLYDSLELPLGQAPLDRLAFPGMLKELDRGARLEQCDWQLLPRLRQEGYELLIPDMQGMRELSALLALRCRREIRERRFEQAVYSLQTSLALSRHVAEAPTLVTYLIGAACAVRALECIEQFIQQPGAPNLYWALTDLPRPLLDQRRALQGERVMVDAVFPAVRRALNDASAPPIPLQTVLADLKKLDTLNVLNGGSAPMVDAVQIALQYPKAREYLLSQGRTAEQIDALSTTQVSLMHSLAEYDRRYEAAYRLNNLPFWEANPRLQAREPAAPQTGNNRGRLIEALASNPSRVYLVKARMQRHVDLLRCVEALRLYANSHPGKLPGTLDEIREVPIPLDPMTGKAFLYSVVGNRAVLEGPPPPGESAAPHNAIRIELTLAAAANKKD